MGVESYKPKDTTDFATKSRRRSVLTLILSLYTFTGKSADITVFPKLRWTAHCLLQTDSFLFADMPSSVSSYFIKQASMSIPFFKIAQVAPKSISHTTSGPHFGKRVPWSQVAQGFA